MRRRRECPGATEGTDPTTYGTRRRRKTRSQRIREGFGQARAYNAPAAPRGPAWRGGREAEGSRLLSGLGGSCLPRGFESHPLRSHLEWPHAPVAQPDRASVYETEGHWFESSRARLRTAPLRRGFCFSAREAPSTKPAGGNRLGNTPGLEARRRSGGGRLTQAVPALGPRGTWDLYRDDGRTHPRTALEKSGERRGRRERLPASGVNPTPPPGCNLCLDVSHRDPPGSSVVLAIPRTHQHVPLLPPRL